MSFIDQIPTSEKSSVHVTVRIRPLNERENNTLAITETRDTSIIITNPDNKLKKNFMYDLVYGVDTPQKQLYTDIGSNIVDNAFKGYNCCVFAYGQTGCFAQGTPIMLNSGIYKPVETLTTKDILMGDDSTPRRILYLFNGYQNMYKIKPSIYGHNSYIVNEDHIMVFKINANVMNMWDHIKLCWVVQYFDIKLNVIKNYSFIPTTTDAFNIAIAKLNSNHFMKTIDQTFSTVEMPIKQYVKLPNIVKKYYMCFTTNVDFPERSVLVDPFLIGQWLGGKRDLFYNNFLYMNIIDKYNLQEESYIPDDYKINTREIRTQILTGLINTPCYINLKSDTVKLTNLYKKLTEDIIFLAKSLGYHAYSYKKKIRGSHNKTAHINKMYDCHIDGLKIVQDNDSKLYKIIMSSEKHTQCLFNFTVEKLDVGEYYGFMLNKNHRFIGAGFNVLRNSGKTYSMMGGNSDSIGLIPRICENLFVRQQNHNDIDQGDCGISYRIEVSYLEIYSERVKDLMDPETSKSLKVRQHPEYGPYVENLTQLLVEDYSSIKRIIDKGNKERHTAATLMNGKSSRSHAILTIYFTQLVEEFDIGKTREVVSKINLVDLAGSERVDASGVTGINFKEAIMINKSLSTLGLVISNLAAKAGAKKSKEKTVSKKITRKTKHKGINLKKKIVVDHIPFRDSTLTWLLKESLGGNSKTYMIANISPSSLNYNESLNTLRYAYNAKQIVNTVKINEDPNDKIIRVLRDEIRQLKIKLDKNPSGILNTDEMCRLEDEINQREGLMRTKEKSWVVKLEESRRINDESQKQLKQEMALKQIEFLQKINNLNDERENLLNEVKVIKITMSEKELKHQMLVETELSKTHDEYKKKQAVFEQGRIMETAVSLQEYYEKKINNLKDHYEEKLHSNEQERNIITVDEIDRLKESNQTLKTHLTNNQKELQVQMRQFTNDRAVLSKQIQQLQSKIHVLENGMRNSQKKKNGSIVSENDCVLSNDIEKKRKEYASIKLRRDEEERKYNILQTDYHSLTSRIENNKVELTNINIKHGVVMSEIDKSTDQLTELKGRYINLQNKFEADQDEYNHLLIQKEKLHTEITQLKVALDIHVNNAKIKLCNPTISDLQQIQDGFDVIFNNIKNIDEMVLVKK